MALSQVGSSTVGEAGTGTSLNLPVPASLSTNDLVVACVHLFDTAKADTITAPAGFTELSAAEVTQTSTDSVADNHALRIFYKYFAGESGNYAFSWTHSNVNAACCNVIRGAIVGSVPIDSPAIATAQTTNSGSLPSATQSWPVATAPGFAQANEIVVAFIANDQGAAINTATGWNVRQNQADGPATIDQQFSSAGTQANTSVVMSGTCDQIWSAVPILVSALGSGSPTRTLLGVGT